MEIAKLVLSYFQAILNWPVMGAVLAFYFLKTYRLPVTNFLNRIVKGQGFGLALEAISPSEQQKEGQETAAAIPAKIPAARELKEASEAPTAQVPGDGYMVVAQAVIKQFQDNPQQAVAEYADLYNGYKFERAYNWIYGTQIRLLEYLAISGDQGDTYANLYVYFTKHTQLMPEGAMGQYNDYIGFLEIWGFISIAREDAESRVRIRPYGISFLDYIKKEYRSAYNAKIG